MPTSRVATRGHHAVSIVEAGYSLEGTDSDWLARVLEAASPDLDRGLGSYGFTCCVSRGKIEMGPGYAERCLDPTFAKLVAELNRTVPDDFFDLIAQSAIVCGGFEETVPPALRAHLQEVGPSVGVVDGFALFAQDGEGYAVNLTGPSSSTVAAPARVRGLWSRVGVHLASALRLRRRMSSSRAVRDAILEPSGTIAHAEGDLRDDRPALRSLAAAVRDIERARTTRERNDPERAMAMWRGLVAGEWSLIDQWEDDGRRYVAAYRNRPNVRDPRALTAHERVILHYAALGESNKGIAFTLGMSTSSVATGVSQVLRKLGGRRRSDLLAFADMNRASELRLSLGDDDEVGVLSLPNAPQDAVAEKLSEAEREIGAMIIEGRTNAAIARTRKTSRHTVANQVRSMFDKLGVGSRTELARRLTRGE
jgi:DNA-binding NarL/FixJ family response regulator